MSRVPEPGRTKTRLVPALGSAGACELAAAFLADLQQRFAAFPVQRRWLAWAQGAGGHLPQAAGFEAQEQGPGDLGERLVRLFRAAEPPVVFLGSDAPTLPARCVAQAFEALEGPCDLVFQPALDGGFTLAGFTRDPQLVLDQVPWGTEAVLATVLRQSGLLAGRVGLLDPWYDVDVPDDLQRLRAHLELLVGQEAYPRRTADVLSRMALLHECSGPGEVK